MSEQTKSLCKLQIQLWIREGIIQSTKKWMCPEQTPVKSYKVVK